MADTRSYTIEERFFFLISWERISTRASPNGIPRDIYSSYVQLECFIYFFIAMVPYSCNCVAQKFYGIWSRFDWSCSMWKMALKNLETSMCLCGISLSGGGGRFCSTVGLSFKRILHSNMRCRAVCSAFSRQVQSGVGTFSILWKYERKQNL